MSAPANLAKRRRLNDPSSALSKPFKSPLRAVPKASDASLSDPKPIEDSVRHKPEHKSQLTASPSKDTNTTPPAPLLPKTPVRGAPNASLRSSPTKDPTVLALQKQHSQLLRTLSELRSALDTAQQALKIESSNTDDELDVLIAKWRFASREAAEEVFRGAKDRVNRMGGVGAWREKSRQKPFAWDEDDRAGQNPDIDEDDLNDEQKDELARRKEELAEEMEAERERLREKEEEQRSQKEGEKDDEVRNVFPIDRKAGGSVSTNHSFALSDFHNGHDAEESEH